MEHMIEHDEPFLLNQRTEAEMTEYGAEFNATLAGDRVDKHKE